MARENASKAPSTTYGIRLTVAMVVFSWVGLQLMFLAAGVYYRKLNQEAVNLVGCAIVLLVYSLNLKLRLNKREITPLREQAQLFYTVMFVLLPVLTFFLRYNIYHRWLILGVPFWAGSVVTTLIYLMMFLFVLKSEAYTYPRAGREAWSRRAVRVLRVPLDWLGRVRD
jgi:uncharacterized membrane protein (DUF485 family)